MYETLNKKSLPSFALVVHVNVGGGGGGGGGGNQEQNLTHNSPTNI